MWPFKKKQEFKYSELELKCLENFMRGFELGTQMSSEIDSKIKDKIRQEAAEIAFERMHGNNKKTD